ncbi:MAG: TIGR04255 family protein [Rhodospirillales bacterium]|nr:TIGR04255 family protein [Rhodospirillales bacterium]
MLEIQYAEPISDTAIDRVAARLKSTYPDHQSRIGVNLSVQDGQATLERVPEGVRLASKDQADVLLLSASKVASARLAPYTSWEQFSARARDDHEAVKKVTDYRKANRLGLRYINRIDIPGKEFAPAKYLKIGMSVPNEIVKQLHAYSVSGIYSLAVPPYQVNLNSGVVDPVLVDHTSLLLDIDLYLADGVSSKESDIWSEFERMRTVKNKVFEACITEEARALFDS